MRRQVVLFLVALAAGLGTRSHAQRGAVPSSTPDQAVWLDAVDDWQAGRYPEALKALTAIAAGPSADEFHDRIALLTGDLYSTVEITHDGRNPRLSQNAQYLSYEAGPVGRAVTRVVQTRPNVAVIAELPTTMVVFDPAGTRLAWLRSAKPGARDSSEIAIRDLTTGSERTLPAPGLSNGALAWSAAGDGILLIGRAPEDASRSDVYLVRDGAAPEPLTTGPGLKGGLLVDPTGRFIAYYATQPGGTGTRDGGPGNAPRAHILDLTTRADRIIPGVSPGSLTMSADGSTIAWIAPAADGAPTLYASAPAGAPSAIRSASGSERIAAPALSPDGRLIAYQFQARVGSSTDWEIYVSDRAGRHRRLTREIQHDVLPRFLDADTVLGLIGEPRHRRSHLYDIQTGERTRLFTNNTIRTISPEYGWVASADGSHLAVQADRDGDTISPARGVYLVNMTRKVTGNELRQRLQAQLRHETDLRDRMTAAYKPIAEDVRRIVSRVSIARVFDCHRAHADFDSKHITQPGNAKAIEHLQRMYASFGYSPEVQPFTVERGKQPPIRTANVVATLQGTTNPELIYIASSHFDSTSVGPGADDNTSGTCALLEAARVLAAHPLPATVVFASFTGEEAGLLGSEEFVRLARERQWRVAGALNNDMIGWAADGARIDNTIRYSNRGIRDLQHGAAFLFSDLVTFDAHYFYGTDAATFHEVWGDVFAGIGSYPILGNPNYHQPSDLIETISFKQVAETAKVTAASLVALASSPSRLGGLAVQRRGGQIDIQWKPAVESGVTSYLVAYGPPDDPRRTRVTVKEPRASVTAPPGTQVSVKAVNSRGLESWDWATTAAP